MSCPLCWHSFEEEISTMLRFQVCRPPGLNESDPFGGAVNVQVCPNCGLSLFMMPNEPLRLLGEHLSP